MTEQHEGPHAAEAEARWGDTDAWKESKRRTATYSESDWAAIKADLEQIEADFATALDSEVSPGDEAAMALAERARLHIDDRLRLSAL